MTQRLADRLRDYTFLYELGFDPEALAEWSIKADQRGLSLHEALRHDGRIDDMAYVRALGRALAVSVVEPRNVPPLRPSRPDDLAAPRMGIAARSAGATLYVLDGLAGTPEEVRKLVDELLASPDTEVALACPAGVRSAVRSPLAERLVDRAVRQMLDFDPSLSASRRMWVWQSLVIAVSLGLGLGAYFIAPALALTLAIAGLAIIFLVVVLLRLLALAVSLGLPIGAGPPVRLPVATLPVYSVLVPLFHEARIVPDLIRALKQIKYPRARLDVKLVLEAADKETQRAVSALRLGPEFEVIVVPDAMPRTKPKALNYALNFVRGDYLVIFDAEDIPEPDQLLRALATFRSGDERIGAVQARLAIDNPGDGLLARQFALEYMALFDGLLPALDRLGLPIPLGGTSTHFPTEVVRRVGGWDPHNVTEDADLGMRLARLGYRCATIASRTYEEAPFHFGAWIRQRTRWIKGWLQTLLVHTRRPVRLLVEMGPVGSLAFITLLGGTLLSALAHPISLAVVVSQALQGDFMQPSGDRWNDALVAVSAGNLLFGYSAAMALVIVSAVRRRAWGLLPWSLLVPLYWLLISVAAYRALLQLATAPHRWEKTEHGISRRRRPPPFSGK